MARHRIRRRRSFHASPMLVGLIVLSFSAFFRLSAQDSKSKLPGAGLGGTVTPPAAAVALAFQNVTVIDVTDGRLLAEQTVLVVGNRVQTVGPAREVLVPTGAQVVDARGKYLMPGFWDMHVHLGDTNGIAQTADSIHRVMEPRFIAHGVTGVREMAQRFQDGADSFRGWQRAIAAGTRVGPRGVGPSVDMLSGNGVFESNIRPTGENPHIVRISTPDGAARIVDSLKLAGIVFLKFHDDFSDIETYFALAAAARRAGLPLVGHTPFKVSDVQVADSGQRSIEHVTELRCFFQDPTQPQVGGEAEATACAEVAVPTLIRNGTWVVPTLRTFNKAPPFYTEKIPHAMHTLRRLGFTRFLAGTDFYFGVNYAPGFSLLEEIVQLVETGGLTPLSALQAATLNPATFFDAKDSLGGVAPGKLADLVLLDGNPLVDIHNVMTTNVVVANGRYFDNAALDALDPEGRKMAKDALVRLRAVPADAP